MALKISILTRMLQDAESINDERLAGTLREAIAREHRRARAMANESPEIAKAMHREQ